MFKERKSAPEIAALQHIQLLEPEIFYSERGLPIHLMRKVPNDIFHAQIEFGAGKMQQSKPLVSAFTAELLFSGTSKYNQLEIQELFDVLGAFVNLEAALSNTTLHVYGLTTKFDAIFEIIDHVMTKANFPEEVFELHRRAAKQRHLISMDKNDYLARREFLKALYPTHPIGKVADANDFEEINLIDCSNFYQKHLARNVQQIHLVGDVSKTQVELLKKMFDPRFTTLDNDFILPELADPRDLYIEKTKALQSTIRIGQIMFTPKHSDYFEFDILETILGGYFGSRLMQNLREDKGYTYGIGSGLTTHEHTGYFFISTEVGKQHKDAALEAIKFEINKLREELISDDELQLAKAHIRGQILKSTDGAFAQMSQFLFTKRFNLPENHLNQFLDTLHEITPQRLRELAQTYLDWEKMTKVVVG